jgi:hypothetical protein
MRVSRDREKIRDVEILERELKWPSEVASIYRAEPSNREC